jgi:glycosyltransferase involved in cell wall biosynthesis
MKVLITNNHLQHFGGTETWVVAVAEECKRRGFNVDIFSFYTSDVFKKEIFDRFNVFNTLEGMRKKYDLILVNHNTCLEFLLNNGIQGKKIYTCHSVVANVEYPIKGADKYVAVSEEIQKFMKNKDFKAELIFNGVNCSRFFPDLPIKDYPKKVLLISDYGDTAKIVMNACLKLGLYCEIVGKLNPTAGIEKSMNEADIVISLGRGCYEAMACGRNVIVFDVRNYNGNRGDGIIEKDTLLQMLRFNCSGRGFNYQFDEERMVSEIGKYRKEYGEFNRDFALRNLNIENKVEQYLNL